MNHMFAILVASEKLMEAQQQLAASNPNTWLTPTFTIVTSILTGLLSSWMVARYFALLNTRDRVVEMVNMWDPTVVGGSDSSQRTAWRLMCYADVFSGRLKETIVKVAKRVELFEAGGLTGAELEARKCSIVKDNIRREFGFWKRLFTL